MAVSGIAGCHVSLVGVSIFGTMPITVACSTTCPTTMAVGESSLEQTEEALIKAQSLPTTFPSTTLAMAYEKAGQPRPMAGSSQLASTPTPIIASLATH